MDDEPSRARKVSFSYLYPAGAMEEMDAGTIIKGAVVGPGRSDRCPAHDITVFYCLKIFQIFAYIIAALFRNKQSVYFLTWMR